MPSAEGKVCQRQMRKKKNVAEFDRKAETGAMQTHREKEGEACHPGRAAGVLNESCPCGGKGAGERCQPWERCAGRARLPALLGRVLFSLCCALGSQGHCWGHPCPPGLEE